MGAAFVLMVPMIYLSGLIFPIENMPQAIQLVTYAIPLRYYADIIRGIFLSGSGIDVLWPQALTLLLMGVVDPDARLAALPQAAGLGVAQGLCSRAPPDRPRGEWAAVDIGSSTSRPTNRGLRVWKRRRGRGGARPAWPSGEAARSGSFRALVRNRVKGAVARQENATMRAS